MLIDSIAEVRDLCPCVKDSLFPLSWDLLRKSRNPFEYGVWKGHWERWHLLFPFTRSVLPSDIGKTYDVLVSYAEVRPEDNVVLCVGYLLMRDASILESTDQDSHFIVKDDHNAIPGKFRDAQIVIFNTKVDAAIGIINSMESRRERRMRQ